MCSSLCESEWLRLLREICVRDFSSSPTWVSLDIENLREIYFRFARLALSIITTSHFPKRNLPKSRKTFPPFGCKIKVPHFHFTFAECFALFVTKPSECRRGNSSARLFTCFMKVVTSFGLLQRSHPSLIENLNSLTHALRKHSQPEINIWRFFRFVQRIPEAGCNFIRRDCCEIHDFHVRHQSCSISASIKGTCQILMRSILLGHSFDDVWLPRSLRMLTTKCEMWKWPGRRKRRRGEVKSNRRRIN